jgi:hypothetical protein
MIASKDISAYVIGDAAGAARSASDRHIVLAVLAGIAAVKAIALVFIGPLFQIDSGGYIAFADVIIGGSGWIAANDLHVPTVDSLRMVGYPAIIAGAKIVFGGDFAWAVVVFQTALGALATVLFFRAAVAVTASVRVAAVLVVAYLFSPALQYDLFILTDSLYASLFTILTSLIVTAWAERRPASPALVLALGALLAASFLIRETSMPFGALFLPLVVLWASNRGWRAAALAGLLFLLPLGATWEGYRQWNEARSGEKFITTANGVVLLYALASMDSLDRQAFLEETPLDSAIRDSRAADGGASPAVFMTEALAAMGILGGRYGLSGTEIERAARERFFRIARSRPLLMVRKMGYELASDAVWGEVNPARTVRELIRWRDQGEFEGIRAFVARLKAERRPSDAAFFALEALSRTAGAICLLAFLASPLVAGLGVLRRRDRNALMTLALFIPPAGVIAAYATVCLTQRYLIGVVPAILLCAALTLRALFAHRCCESRL